MPEERRGERGEERKGEERRGEERRGEERWMRGGRRERRREVKRKRW